MLINVKKTLTKKTYTQTCFYIKYKTFIINYEQSENYKDIIVINNINT